jgi:hypothetical protein
VVSLDNLDKQIQNRDEFLQDIRERLLQAQDYMKASHDKNHRSVKFAAGTGSGSVSITVPRWASLTRQQQAN